MTQKQKPASETTENKTASEVRQHYIEHDNEVRFVDIANLSSIVDKIPAGIYTFVYKEDMNKDGKSEINSYLNKAKDFTLPAKLYGNVVERAEHILSAYQKLDKNMGVLLSGLAGAGKSLLIKYIANEAKNKLHLPVIIFDSENVRYLPKFLDKVSQPCVFMLDEFEKLTNRYEQEILLTVFDGIYSSKNLFLLTVNDKKSMVDHFFSRPGRIRYIYNYQSIETEVIESVLHDKLEDKSKLDEVSLLLSTVHRLSFDILYSFIEEVNLFKDKEPKELFKHFNTELSSRQDSGYELEVKCGDILITNIFTFKIDSLNLESLREGGKFRVNIANKHNEDGFNKQMPWNRDPIEVSNPLFEKADDLKISFNNISFTYEDKDGTLKKSLIELSSKSLNPIGDNPPILRDKKYHFSIVK